MASPASSLQPLRLKLTLWYLATLSAIIALLGGGLFLAIGHRYTRELDRSLRDATAQVERAAATREYESATHGNVVDALTELHIPDRTLYLFDSAATPITPAIVPDWVLAAAGQLKAARTLDLVHHLPHGDETILFHGERFTLSSGRTLIAAAAADNVELEDRYAELITAFAAAAAIALVMVAIGGWLLVRQATAPIERNIAQMRRFMADAAHELRTPITVLRAQAEVTLQRERQPEEYLAALRAIESESRRLGRIVDDLLTLARADSGDRPAAFAPLFLDDIVADAVGAAAAMAAAREVGLALGRFEEAPVLGDAELLRQLVMILLDNAIKFTPTGGNVSVSVGRTDSGVELRVDDTGPGIPAAQLPHLFERFYRGDPARGRSGSSPVLASGAGLGLSIAHWITNAHGATIQIMSTEDQGTHAQVDFPAPMVSSS